MESTKEFLEALEQELGLNSTNSGELNDGKSRELESGLNPQYSGELNREKTPQLKQLRRTNKMSKNEVLKVEISEEVVVEVQPNVEHEWLLSSKDVAEGYGLSASGLRSAKSKHSGEFEEGKHFIGVANGNTVGNGGSKKTMWTKKGVIRLGFLIKTPLAKQFRDWAEGYGLSESGLRMSKSRYSDELIEDIHFVQQIVTGSRVNTQMS